jgi:hypothetical protein
MDAVELMIGNQKVLLEGEWDKGEEMVWRYKDGSGHPGSPAGFCTTKVSIPHPHYSMNRDYDINITELMDAVGGIDRLDELATEKILESK